MSVATKVPEEIYLSSGNESSVNSVQNIGLKTILILVSLTLLAALIRSPDLGKWSLTEDEYFFSRAVSFILEKGIPEFPDGGYYDRGIALQYLTAVSALFFNDWEFAVRLFPLIFGVLTIPLFYLFCKVYLPTLPALLCTTMLLLSSWHIEMSRFARMYTPFQFVFLVFLYFLYSGYWQGKRNHQITAWFLAFVSIFFYEASIFLPFLLLLALLSENSRLSTRKGVELIVVAAILLGLNYLEKKINFRSLGVENAFPIGLPPVEKDSPLVLPRLSLLLAVWNSLPFVIGYLMLVGFAVLVFLKQLQKKADFWSIVLIALTAFLPLVHQFGLLFFVLILFFLGRKNTLYLFIDNGRIWIPYLFITLIFWLSFGFLSTESWLPGSNLLVLAKEVANNLFRYPQVYDSAFYAFSKTVPIWGFFAMLAISISVIRNLFSKEPNSDAFPLLVVLVCLLLLGILRTLYTETRYSFFFFPLVLTIGYMETVALVRWLDRSLKFNPIRLYSHALILIPLLAFLFTEDFNFHHILNVSSKETNFRMGEYESLSNHWYGRGDYEGPARFVNSAYKEGDVIVIDNVTSSFYLNEPFVNYIPLTRTQIFRNQARKRGQEEVWTGRPLIYTLDAFINLVPPDPHNSLWFIATQKKFGGGPFIENPSTLAEWNHLKATRVFEGVDGRIAVWQFNRHT